MIQQTFPWHAQTGTYRVGAQRYLVMDGQGQEGVQCSRKLVQLINDRSGALELHMRVVVGKRYAIRLYSNRNELALELIIAEDGWLHASGPGGLVSTRFYLTWFSGRPTVDPSFIPEKGSVGGKTIESDELSFWFGGFDFSSYRLSFSLDNGPIQQMQIAPVSDIARVDLVAFPSREAGNRIRLKKLMQFADDQCIDAETFPIDWEPIGKIQSGYPDDNTLAASTRPRDFHWLECSGEYCWVRGHLPCRLDGDQYELSFDLRAADIEKESCVELHQDDGTMAQSMIPIKVGIIRGQFFSGFASRVKSSLLGEVFWKSQQTLYPQITPVAGTTYHIRIRWNRRGYYQWWVNDIAMRFSGMAKTGDSFQFPGFELPGFRIPFWNELITKPFSGVDIIALHYGLVSPSPHVAFYGNFRIESHSG